MKEIYYPDGSVGLVSEERLKNPNIIVVNPDDDDDEGGGRRATSRHTLITTIDGDAVKIDAGFLTIKSREIIASQKRTMKAADGEPVKEITYVKATGQLLPPKSTGKKLVKADGTEVAKSDVRYFVQTDIGEKEVEPFLKTQDIKLEFKPSGTEDGYVYARQYEIVPQSDAARWEMWKLAKYMWDNGLVAVGIVVPDKGWTKYGVLIKPYIDEAGGQFSLMAIYTQKKLELSRPQKIPTGKPEERKVAQIETGVEELF